jgi:hypothetical protein
MAGRPAEVVSQARGQLILRLTRDGKTIRVHFSQYPRFFAPEREGRFAFEDQDYALLINPTGAYLIPSPVIAAAQRAVYQLWAADPSHNRQTATRCIYFDGESNSGPYRDHGFAIAWKQYRLGDAEAVPAPVANVQGDLILVLELPDRRAYFGRPIDACTQMHADAIFVHESEPAVDAWIKASLARMGVNGPATPEFFLGALAAKGQIEIYPPGCRIAPSVDGL